MGSFSPLQIALLIVAGLSFVGVIIAFIRSQMTLSGYGEIALDVRELGSALHAQVFRDGADVVVSGTYERAPVVVRFSNAENTPGLNIRMQAPATFTMSVVPTGASVTEGGRVLVKTTDNAFDARFNTRTDQPTQAKMFLTRGVTMVMQRLVYSKNTYLSLGEGAIELSELIIPQPNTAKHVLDHLKSMANLSQLLHLMPGSDRVKLAKFKRERHLAARVAMAVGSVVAVLSVVAAMKAPSRPAITGNETLSAGILPIDAIRIPDTRDWRIANSGDLDPAALSWLRNNGKEPNSRVEGDFSGKGTGHDVAYLLVGRDGTRRVVLLADHINRYDTKFPYIGMAARVPKSMVTSIQWVGGKPPEDAEGDGLLLVRKPDDPTSAIVLFLGQRGIVSASPVNYQNISLE